MHQWFGLRRLRVDSIEVLINRAVYIGSHSHRFYAIDLRTGGVRWVRQLPDRIESSAAISLDRHTVFVGWCGKCHKNWKLRHANG